MKFTTTMGPRQVEAYLREQILKLFGDKVENRSTATGQRGGRYRLFVDLDSKCSIEFKNFRKGDVPKIVKALRDLA